jgi:hypothetical protein
MDRIVLAFEEATLFAIISRIAASSVGTNGSGALTKRRAISDFISLEEGHGTAAFPR